MIHLCYGYWQPCFTCPLKHAAGGVICQGASILPTSYWHGCRLQLLFQTVLPTYKLQLVFLSVSCRLLSRNSVQTSKDMSLEPVEFFRHICFLSAWKNLTFYQYRQWNSVKLCIRLVGCHPSDSHLAIQFEGYCKWLVCMFVAFLCIDWVGYCENLATVLFADLHRRTCFSCKKINT